MNTLSRRDNPFRNDSQIPKADNTFDAAPRMRVEDLLLIKAEHETLHSIYFWVDPNRTLVSAGSAYLNARYQREGRIV